MSDVIFKQLQRYHTLLLPNNVQCDKESSLVDKVHVFNSIRLRINIEVVAPMFIWKVIKLAMPELECLFMVRAVVPLIVYKRQRIVRICICFFFSLLIYLPPINISTGFWDRFIMRLAFL